MARMGHASARAALIYQHATRDRDTAIARAIGELIESSMPGLRRVLRHRRKCFTEPASFTSRSPVVRPDVGRVHTIMCHAARGQRCAMDSSCAAGARPSYGHESAR
jgi:hypothetical protein